MELRDLLRAGQYADAVEMAEVRLGADPDDWGAINGLASALQAVGKFEDALPLFEKLDRHDRSDPVVSGRPGRQKDIACLYWLTGRSRDAIQSMHGLAQGVLDGSVRYGDAAGGLKQGLLLYYMGAAVEDAGEKSFALSYLRDRVKRIDSHAYYVWPIPVARFYLEEIGFENVLQEAAGGPDLANAIKAAGENLMIRRKMCVALFHDGVFSATGGHRNEFLSRMRECYSLQNPLLEPEWYLARNEVERIDKDISR
jgi:tetratricopeptide (TPR) repeat protein